VSQSSMNSDQLKRLIREVRDFPKKDILFYDITTLLKEKRGLKALIDQLSEHISTRALIWCWAWKPAGSFSPRLWPMP
jgi:adenine/guanine phosphoribosyltransferase-like PRPP-binding protein